MLQKLRIRASYVARTTCTLVLRWETLLEFGSVPVRISYSLFQFRFGSMRVRRFDGFNHSSMTAQTFNTISFTKNDIYELVKRLHIQLLKVH